MSLFEPGLRTLAELVSDLTLANPFLPERREALRRALGSSYDDQQESSDVTGFLQQGRSANVRQLNGMAGMFVESLREQILGGETATDDELALYERLVLYVLYARQREGFERLVMGDLVAPLPEPPADARGYPEFATDVAHLTGLPGRRFPLLEDLPHCYAMLYQLRRAYMSIVKNLAGTSAPMVRLRASIWQSIFTHDLQRYWYGLHRSLPDFPTLITGPSGTGKERVAQAIAESAYLPFDPRSQTFAARPETLFKPVNLAALTPSLIESELFGHRRGAFTGALQHREGWLTVCGPHGTVFLDEIGELDGTIQVKLLRVLQDRLYQPVGDTTTRRFTGKLVTATNRDLGRELAAGRFRSDLYYRLCADRVETPSLREQLDDRPGDLRPLVGYVLRQIFGTEPRGEVRDEISTWIEANLGVGYPWQGNFRELEQCVRNVLLRRSYRPVTGSAEDGTEVDRLCGDLRRGTITAEALVARYVRLVYGQTRSYVETARRLGLDRRTVKRHVEGREPEGTSEP